MSGGVGNHGRNLIPVWAIQLPAYRFEYSETRRRDSLRTTIAVISIAIKTRGNNEPSVGSVPKMVSWIAIAIRRISFARFPSIPGERIRANLAEAVESHFLRPTASGDGVSEERISRELSTGERASIGCETAEGERDNHHRVRYLLVRINIPTSHGTVLRTSRIDRTLQRERTTRTARRSPVGSSRAGDSSWASRAVSASSGVAGSTSRSRWTATSAGTRHRRRSRW